MERRLEHVARPALPWRSTADKTECGLAVDDRTTITHDDLRAKVVAEGKHRAAMSTCMTCWGRVAYARLRRDTSHPQVDHVAREALDLRERERLGREFAALGILAGRHREEFAVLCDDIASTPSLRGRELKKRGGRT